MKGLSVKQPWAWAIFHLFKDIENRTWRTKLRGKILIHAGKTLDIKAPKLLLEMWADEVIKNPTGDQTKFGGIIGSVEIVDCVANSTSKWFQGPFGFVLKNPKSMDFIPYKGQLNFFEVKL